MTTGNGGSVMSMLGKEISVSQYPSNHNPRDDVSVSFKDDMSLSLRSNKSYRDDTSRTSIHTNEDDYKSGPSRSAAVTIGASHLADNNSMLDAASHPSLLLPGGNIRKVQSMNSIVYE